MRRVGVQTFLDREVEVRAGHGAMFRGRLLSADGQWLVVEQHGCRKVLVPITSLVAVVDVTGRTLREEADHEEF
jgi:hypothetical protein